ncbi:MAG: hypothetical protein DLM70_09445 [Chloroflexi bacterium]|nr:MAG: hypothetical protein DLM70_09445 [Chloroflexota bacterium]
MLNMMTESPEYLTIQAAADVLNTNRRRIWQLVKDGQLQAIENPLDRRSKLILCGDVARFIKFANIKKP